MLKASNKLVEMYKAGQIDATTAMRMLADLSADPVPACPPAKGPESKKRPAPSEPDSSDGEHEEQELHACLDNSNLDSQLLFLKQCTCKSSLIIWPMIKLKHHKLTNKTAQTYNTQHLTYSLPTSKDSKAKAALKAKLRRLCEAKKGQKLQVPEWLHKKWKDEKGNHLDMALQLQKVGFNKDRFSSVTFEILDHHKHPNLWADWISFRIHMIFLGYGRKSSSSNVRRPTPKSTGKPTRLRLDGIQRRTCATLWNGIRILNPYFISRHCYMMKHDVFAIILSFIGVSWLLCVLSFITALGRKSKVQSSCACGTRPIW